MPTQETKAQKAGHPPGKMKMTHFIAILMMMLAGKGQSHDPRTENPAQAYLQAISMAFSKDQIGKIEILQIPPRILMRGRITPEMLEKQYHNKLIIRDIAATAYQSKLIATFKMVSAQPRAESADVRWGVIFYSRDETRLGAVYFDQSGRYGSVNDMPVSFRGEFFHWLDATFSNCFQ
jgi:hypothetical protein